MLRRNLALTRFVMFRGECGDVLNLTATQTFVNCTETNEPFHAQCGFEKEGSLMVLDNSKAIPAELP